MWGHRLLPSVVCNLARDNRRSLLFSSQPKRQVCRITRAFTNITTPFPQPAANELDLVRTRKEERYDRHRSDIVSSSNWYAMHGSPRPWPTREGEKATKCMFRSSHAHLRSKNVGQSFTFQYVLPLQDGRRKA